MTEVVVMGRLSADIYPTQLRTALRDQRSFTRYVGGFAGNVCTGLARLQVSTAIVSKVGNDGHGEFIRDFLLREGVDVGWLGVDQTLNTPVVFCEIWPPDRFPLLFYRTPTCPDWAGGASGWHRRTARGRAPHHGAEAWRRRGRLLRR